MALIKNNKTVNFLQNKIIFLLLTQPKEQEFKPFPEGVRAISLGPFSLPLQLKNLLEHGSMEDRSPRDDESSEQQPEAKPFRGPEDHAEEMDRSFPTAGDVRRMIHQVNIFLALLSQSLDKETIDRHVDYYATWSRHKFSQILLRGLILLNFIPKNTKLKFFLTKNTRRRGNF